MLPITNKFTNCTISNRCGIKPEWIVIHYFGALGSALQTAGWFCNPTNNVGSADFCVDDDYIVQVNPDILKYNTWHCGGGLQGGIHHEYHRICTNANSIGIEMRPYNDRGSVNAAQNAGWYFHEATVANTVDLVKYLMAKFNIAADHVIMHANVTGKYCPAPFLDRPEEWENFKKRIQGGSAVTPSAPVYKAVDVPDYKIKTNTGKDDLNIRKLPTTNSSIVGALKNGTEKVITHKSEDGVWGLLQDIEGWIYLDYTEVVEEKVVTPAPVTPAPVQQIYRIRKTADDAKTQKGAYRNLETAKDQCDKFPGYSVFDADFNVVYPTSFKIRVEVGSLRVRKGAGTDFDLVTNKGNIYYIPKGVYTVTETAEADGYIWGKLASGIGWIALDYVVRI